MYVDRWEKKIKKYGNVITVGLTRLYTVMLWQLEGTCKIVWAVLKNNTWYFAGIMQIYNVYAEIELFKSIDSVS